MGFMGNKLKLLRGLMSKYKWMFVFYSVIALIAGGVSWWLKFNFWLTFLVMLGSSLLTKIIATLEDDMPGGYNNPDGTDTPKYARVLGWVFRVFIVLVILLGMFVFAAEKPFM